MESNAYCGSTGDACLTAFSAMRCFHSFTGTDPFLYHRQGWLPDPLFSVKVRNIHNAKHGSDSHVFDYEGR